MTNLPIFQIRGQIIEALQQNQILIITGETGSGKTTQVPQFIYRSDLLPKGKIIVTQPRRVAATTLARRLSQELNVDLGKEVGYSVRFDERSSHQTRIKFMTDGMVLRELLGNPTLSKYTYVILDEAHERSLRTDILFGVLKGLALGKRKSDLKIIIMSATLDIQKFALFFAPLQPICLSAEGRSFPVKLFYTCQPQQDYLDSLIVSCFQIHQEMIRGDVLAFLTGQEEIEAAAKLLNENAVGLPKSCDKLLICPIYSALPASQQLEVFKPTPVGYRKIVLATNIAETSITIPGIKFVIDSGVVKQRVFNPKSGIESLLICPVSRNAAQQRMGRAGRDSFGFCYRLYTEDFYDTNLKQETQPEIERCNLSSVILNMKAFGIEDVLGFEYLDPPSIDSIKHALEELYALEAIDENGMLTALGKEMAELPLSPQMSKALLKANENKVLAPVIDILASLSIDSLFYAPYEERELAYEARLPFASPSGDHITLLNVLQEYLRNSDNKAWCKQNYIHAKNIKNVMDIRKQLRNLCIAKGMSLECNKECSQEEQILIQKSLLAGFFANVALRHPDGKYKTILSSLPVSIHPSSILFGKKTVIDCIFFHEITFTTKTYARHVTVIEPSWLAECAPKYFGNISFQQ